MPTDLYVSMNGSDSNSGSAASPLRTILKASQLAAPGTNVHVAPGTYAGGFKTTASGTESAPIHYVSDTKWGADIVPAANSKYDMAWDNRGAYVTIDGFEVNGTNYQGGTPWRIGLYSTGSHSAIVNNNVHHIALNVAGTSAGGAGIEGDSYYGGTDINLIGNIVHDIGPAKANTIQGIYQTAPGNVMNNVVYRAAGWGIHLWHDANHVNIVNNTVFNNASGGITVGGGDFVRSQGSADYVKVENNIVYDNKNYGIDEYGATGTHNVYTNNLVYGNGTNFSLQHGLVATNTISTDPKFVHYVATGGGDYHLAAGSPAIDAGTSSGAPKTDLDGHVRAQGAGWDIGAYEYSAATSVAPAQTTSGSATPTTPASSSSSDTSGDSAANLLTGDSLGNTLSGFGGADTLNGGAGADKLLGGAGNDLYIVDNAKDVVNETGGSGIDTVRSSVSLDLHPSQTVLGDVENLKLTDGARISTGNALANVLIGNNLSNGLIGGGGNDTIDGGRANDALTGGGGSDTFLRNGAGQGTDTIKDFKIGRGGDTLDIHDVLSGYDSGKSNLHDFIHLKESGGNTTVQIDSNGAAGGHSFSNAVVLTGVTGVTVDQLVHDGNLHIS